MHLVGRSHNMKLASMNRKKLHLENLTKLNELRQDPEKTIDDLNLLFKKIGKLLSRSKNNAYLVDSFKRLEIPFMVTCHEAVNSVVDTVLRGKAEYALSKDVDIFVSGCHHIITKIDFYSVICMTSMNLINCVHYPFIY